MGVVEKNTLDFRTPENKFGSVEQSQQIAHFEDELDKLVNRFVDEYDMPYATTIGCLQLKVCDMCNQANQEDQEDLHG